MIQKIKESIEVKFGKRIAYQKDCKALSDRLFEHTSQVVSPTTLRRFFGFLATNSNPSRATLDIFSIYCGYSSWNEFTEKNSTTCSNEPIMTLWEKAISSAQQISLKSCKAIKNEMPLGFSNIVVRNFANERINTFLNSSYIATPFVGPGGFGKTTLLVNWYEKFVANSQNHNHVVLFIRALHLENWIGKNIYLEEWLLTILNLSKSRLFDSLNANPNLAPGKFILVLDALDEIELNQAKADRIFSALQQLTTGFSSQWFKLIVSSRLSTWNHFINMAPSMQGWLYADFEHLSSDGTNMPSLSEMEIQRVLDITINTTAKERIVVEGFSLDLTQTISYPYYLQLFIELYKTESLVNLSDRLDLLLEFTKKQIYQSAHPDEKVDIINAIINISEKNKLWGLVKRNDLKKVYPIHLKLAGNYAAAYDQLLSYGIISEELNQNEHGIFTKFIRINQRPLYRLFLLLNLIDQQKGISITLFKHIAQEYEDTPIQGHLLNLAFELAYKQKKVEVLKEFFSLPKKSLEQAFEHPVIHQSLTRDDFMRRELIPLYANSTLARRFLFEESININAIANSSRLLFLNYLQYCSADRDFFIGKVLLYSSNAYGFDFEWVENFSKELSEDKLPHNIPPAIAGLWFTCRFFVAHIKKSPDFQKVSNDIVQFIDNQSPAWSEKDKYTFELALVFGFIGTKQYEYLYNRLASVLRSNENIYLTQEEKALSVYFEFAKWQRTNTFDEATAQRILQYMSDIPSWVSYQTLVIGKSCLAAYYFTRGQIDKAYEHYKKSMEISSIAGYTIFEVKLLVSLANTFKSIGEEERAEECMAFSRSLASNASIIFDAL